MGEQVQVVGDLIRYPGDVAALAKPKQMKSRWVWIPPVFRSIKINVYSSF